MHKYLYNYEDFLLIDDDYGARLGSRVAFAPKRRPRKGYWDDSEDDDFDSYDDGDCDYYDVDEDADRGGYDDDRRDRQ